MLGTMHRGNSDAVNTCAFFRGALGDVLDAIHLWTFPTPGRFTLFAVGYRAPPAPPGPPRPLDTLTRSAHISTLCSYFDAFLEGCILKKSPQGQTKLACLVITLRCFHNISMLS